MKQVKNRKVQSVLKEEKGAITVFSALIFLVLLVFFFALIEGIYIHTAKSRIKRSLESGMTSIMADYNIPLWEKYEIFAVDKNYGQKSDGYFNLRLEDFTRDQFMGNGSYGDSDITTMVTSVKTLTQEDLYGLKIQINEQGEEDKKEAVYEMVFETPKSQGDYSGVTKEYSPEEQVEGTKDPRESLQDFMQNGILSVVVEDTGKLSDLELDPEKITVNTVSIPKIDVFQKDTFPNLSNNISNIKNNTGNAVAYAMEHFGWYGQEKESKTGLNYEIEYLLEKRGSDKANLEAVANDLTGIRYGFNLAYVLGSAELCAQAEALAVALAAEGGPLAIETTKYGILCSLAYAESIRDVRTLFSGGKVPLMKTKATFHLSIETMAEDNGEGSGEEGFDYSQYLMMLCAMRWSEGPDYTAMAELMEYNIRLEYDEFRLENCIYGFSAQAELNLDRKYNAFEFGTEDLYHLFTYYQVEY